MQADKRVFGDETQLAAASAGELEKTLAGKPDALICFAAGETQNLTLRLLCDWQAGKKVDFAQARFIQLDEWVGLDENDEGSCQNFLKTRFYDKAGIPESRIRRYNAKSPDLDGECGKADAFLDRYGPIDFLFLGVGMNGHVGFNEPGSDIGGRTYCRELDATTKTVGRKYFKKAVRLEKGITLGLKDLLEAKKTVIQVTGARKAPVVRDFMSCRNDIAYPVSLFLDKGGVSLFLDKDAAALLP